MHSTMHGQTFRVYWLQGAAIINYILLYTIYCACVFAERCRPVQWALRCALCANARTSLAKQLATLVLSAAPEPACVAARVLLFVPMNRYTIGCCLLCQLVNYIFVLVCASCWCLRARHWCMRVTVKCEGRLACFTYTPLMIISCVWRAFWALTFCAYRSSHSSGTTDLKVLRPYMYRPVSCYA